MRKIYKRIVAIAVMFILTAGIVLEELPLTETQAATYGWNGSTKTEVYPLDNVYWISSPDELAWFAAQVNSGNTFVGKTVYITDYIDLNNQNWTPIGNGNTIDGKVIFENCTIEGLQCASSCAGLFGNVTVSSLTMQNVVIEGASLRGYTDQYVTQKKGIIAGSLTVPENGGVKINTITISGVMDTSTIWRGSRLGGLFGELIFSGENSKLTITNADISPEITSNGNIMAESHAGGIAADILDDSHVGTVKISKTHVSDGIYLKTTYGYMEVMAGGLFGYVTGGNYYIDQCSVDGAVWSIGYAGWAGGIGAHCAYRTMQITNCCMASRVTGQFNGWYGASHNGGGLLGYTSRSGSESCFIDNCLVLGYIGSGCAFVSHAQSTNDITVKDCLFDTSTTALSESDMFGYGEKGGTSNSSVSNSWGYPTARLKVAWLYEDWDTKNIWTLADGEYPSLTWLETDTKAYGAADLENKDIVERVSEYTTSEFFAQYEEIKNSSCSEEEKYRLFTNLYLNNGITDPKEGIAYLSSTSDKRASYLCLTNNEQYMAWQLRDFLVNGGEEGKSLQRLLVVDGLIFNKEAGKWVKPSTYINDEYPGVVKYKNMLYEFMETDTELKFMKNDAVTMVSDLAKEVKTLKGLSDADKSLGADELLKKINAAESEQELRELLRSATLQNIIVESQANPDGVIKYTLSKKSGLGEIYSEVKNLNTCVTIVNMTVEQISDLMILDTKLAAYRQYRSFLEEIRTGKGLDLQLRYAAEQILEEMEEGEVGAIYKNCVKWVEQVWNQTKLSSQVTEALCEMLDLDSLVELNKLISTAAFFSNMVVDMGKVVKYEAYVEGYAQLGEYYANKLEQASAAFVDDRSEENAWEYFRDYNLLYRLRIAGEEAYIQMLTLDSSIPLLKSYGVSPNLDSVKTMIATIKRYHQFTLDKAKNVPLSCQFAVKTVIGCPVDVKVYTPDGELITTLKDGVESDVTNEYGEFAVVKDYSTGDYEKVICFNREDDYVYRINAVDDGLVTLETAVKDDDNLYVSNNVRLQSGEYLMTDVNQMISEQSIDKYSNDNSKDKTVIPVRVTDGDTKATSVALNKETIELLVGKDCVLEPIFAPSNATDQKVIWLSGNDNIASVSDGKITAVSKGKVYIKCISASDGELVAECLVTVKQLTASGNNSGGHSSGGSSGSGSSSGTGTSNDSKENSKQEASEGKNKDDTKTETEAKSPIVNIKWSSSATKVKLLDIDDTSENIVYLKDNLKVKLRASNAKKIYYKIVEVGKKPSSAKYKKYTKTLTIKKSSKARQIYFKIVDKNGNSVQKKTTAFMVDKTAPTVKGVKNGTLYRKSVKIRFSDNSKVISATINGNKLKNGGVISESGDYRVVVKDAVGNKKVVKFSIWKD